MLECLKREGVDIIFGLPGGAVLPIYDALYDFQGLRHILVRQEAAAGHAAEGYARTSGKVGVCLVTSGPAATNLVTALQDALMDSIPIVAFTGQVPTHLIGNDAFQEADNVGITRSATKHNFLVKDGKDLAPIIKEAFYIASTGRPGPVHVDLPKDILVKEWTYEYPDLGEVKFDSNLIQTADLRFPQGATRAAQIGRDSTNTTLSRAGQYFRNRPPGQDQDH